MAEDQNEERREALAVEEVFLVSLQGLILQKGEEVVVVDEARHVEEAVVQLR